MKNAFIKDIRSIHQQTLDRLDNFGQQTSLASSVEYSEAFNNLLGIKMLCYQRYIQHASLSNSLQAGPVENIFREFASQHIEEAEYFKNTLERLNVEIENLARKHPKIRVSLYTVSSGINHMVKENLIAERLSFRMFVEMQNVLEDKSMSKEHHEILMATLHDILQQQEARMNRLSDLLEF